MSDLSVPLYTVQGLPPGGSPWQTFGRMVIDKVPEPVPTDWAVSALLSHKEDGSLPFFVDYQKLLDVTIRSLHPSFA